MLEKKKKWREKLYLQKILAENTTLGNKQNEKIRYSAIYITKQKTIIKTEIKQQKGEQKKVKITQKRKRKLSTDPNKK